ncbi:hypothetical protein P280DRAFT_95766 [Massarina eburnea CBS 473.64]|uniref:Rhodopsin domain-containing protein n=1 Tax=Massarina eburnea CBS 473.64 TaxID=1395130 RepID=A0A6A6RTP3_9PLEO|nr:hypothetical protein P280DRAFT_95766 [Massarina eburnea CBS 473.64]
MAVPDNGPLIVGVTWGLCLVSGGFLGLRLYAKLSRRQGLWWDDHILIISWGLLLVETALTQAGQCLGFGKHTADIAPQNLAIIALGMSVGASISCFASTLSKISFGVTLLRLTTSYTRAFVWFCIVTLFFVMLPSALLTWISCRPMAKAWDSTIEGECWDAEAIVAYGIFNAAWCTWIDFALALLPWKLVWGLQLTIKERVGVGIAMSMGLLAGVCAVVKGMYLMQLAEADFYFNGKDVTIWTAVETATAIVGASIPVLRVFFKNTLDSYFSAHTHTDSTKSSTPPPSLPLSSVQSRRSRRSQHSRYRDEEEAIMKDDDDEEVEYSVNEYGRVYATPRNSAGGDVGVMVQSPKDMKHEGILQTKTVSVQYGERYPAAKGIGTAL